MALAVFLLLQDEDPLRQVQQSSRKALEQASILVSYQGRLDAPQSDPMEISGRALLVGKDLLYIDHRATGGQRALIVRRGDRAVKWHPALEMWVDVEEVADPNAGRGIQNPADVLSVLSTTTAGAQYLEKNEWRWKIRLALPAESLQNLIRGTGRDQEIDWEKVEARAVLEIDPKTALPRKAETEATLPRKEGGQFAYRGSLQVESYGQERELKFVLNEGGKATEIILTDDAKRILGLVEK